MQALLLTWPTKRDDVLANFAAKENFMLLVNIDESNLNTWKKSYPTPVTAVRNIFFYNGEKEYGNFKGVLFAGGIEITYCRWQNLAQAVQSVSSVYADNKAIIGCQYDCPNAQITPSSIFYAFDLQGLGDNLTFRNNHIIKSTTSYKYKGLIVSKTNGAEICNNIINAPVLIKDSKAVSFISNHLEGDFTNLTIQRSIVGIYNNFFEKGTVTSVVIKEDANNYDLSIVTLVNNSFIYYENEHNGLPSEFDIQIDGKVSLEISNSYRYWVRRDMISKTYPMGLSICDENGQAIDAFNNYSYFLSSKGVLKTASSGASVCILSGWALNTGNISWSIMTNNQVRWFIELGNYSYSAILIWDKNRKITQSQVSIGTATPTNNKGVLLWMNGANTIGHQGLVRLIRSGSDGMKYVDLPFVGNHFIYDNGNSVCGFPWKLADGSIEISGITPIGTIEFVGNNVVCRSKNQPISSSAWKNGDVVYNLGTGTNTIWIRNDNNWLAK